MTKQLSPSTTNRVAAFVDNFIRSELVEGLTSDRDSDFINEPERAERCYDAAENGGWDGKTHREVIQDWRDALSIWMEDRQHGGCDGIDRGGRWCGAVRAHFDKVEEWHEKNGSLDQEVG